MGLRVRHLSGDTRLVGDEVTSPITTIYDVHISGAEGSVQALTQVIPIQETEKGKKIWEGSEK